MDIAARLKRLRKEKGLTQADLAELANTTQQTIQRIESRQSKGKRVVEQVAKALEVSPSWLLFGEKKDVPSKISSPQFRQIPVLSWISAGNGISTEHYDINDISEYVSVPMCLCGPKSYALIIKGDSMECNSPGKKSFLTGEKIVIDPEKMPYSSCFVVALINSQSEAVFKQYFEDGPKHYLKPLNPDYPIVEMTEEMRIIGVVVAHIDYLK